MNTRTLINVLIGIALLFLVYYAYSSLSSAPSSNAALKQEGSAFATKNPEDAEFMQPCKQSTLPGHRQRKAGMQSGSVLLLLIFVDI